MSVLLQRLPLTALLLRQLRTVQVDGADLLVGDHVIPAGSGWQSDPNRPGSKHVPYVVLTTLTATQVTAASMTDAQPDWLMPYAIQSFSALPEGAQWMADHTRAALVSLRGEVVDLVAARYKIDYLKTDQFGGVSRAGQGSTTFYGIQDGVSLSLRRRRS